MQAVQSHALEGLVDLRLGWVRRVDVEVEASFSNTLGRDPYESLHVMKTTYIVLIYPPTHIVV